MTSGPTRRLAILGGIVVLLAIMLTPPLRTYLLQQQEYSDLQTTVAQQQQRVSDLEQRNRQWEDPTYVERQARDRLRFVRPGESSYVVVGGETLRESHPQGPLSVIDPPVVPGTTSWYSRMWSSVEQVDTLDTSRGGAPVTPLSDAGTPAVQDATPEGATP